MEKPVLHQELDELHLLAYVVLICGEYFVVQNWTQILDDDGYEMMAEYVPAVPV
jgi:hypothetical protein